MADDPHVDQLRAELHRAADIDEPAARALEVVAVIAEAISASGVTIQFATRCLDEDLRGNEGACG
jgi:hypothetical protein